MSANQYEIREYLPGDEEGIVQCFNDVFEGGDERFVGRDVESWHWSFTDNPAGWRVYVAVCDGRVVAQCAAQPLRMIVEGAEAIFAQGVDSMTHPAHRRGLKRPGLFVNTANAFFDRYGGADRDVRLTAARDRASIPDAIPANGLPIAGASSSSISSSSSSSSSP